MEEKKDSKAKYVITIICFLAFILFFGIGELVEKDKDFSETENRSLQQMPEINSKDIFSGKFGDDLEKYLADQMVGKDKLVTVKTDVEKTLGKSYLNGVYFGKDGYYLQDYQENKGQIDKNLKYINDFADKIGDSAKVNFMLVPNAVSVYEDKLPKNNKTDNQKDTIDYVQKNLTKNINFYSPYEDFKNHKDVDLYYKTDHHWTSDGAYIGFQGLMKSMGETALQENFTCETLENFRGTLYSKAPSFFSASDKVKLYSGKNNQITVTYNGTSGDNPELASAKNMNVVRNSLFDDKYKTEKDKYKTFLGGNFDLLQIDSQGESDENVLVIKDSYANTVMPFLAQKYKHISVIDLRYYHMQEKYTVEEFVKNNNISKVILLYNVDFLNSDVNFCWLE